MWQMYFIFIYENRRMKLAEVVLRGWGGSRKENVRGSKFNKYIVSKMYLIIYSKIDLHMYVTITMYPPT
jgi:hypothetical protein